MAQSIGPRDRLSEPHTADIHTHGQLGLPPKKHHTHSSSTQCIRVAGSKNMATGERGDSRKVLGHLLCFLKHDMTNHDKKTGLAPRGSEELAQWPREERF